MFLGYQVPELASSSTCFLSYGQFHKTQSNNTFKRSDDPSCSPTAFPTHLVWERAGLNSEMGLATLRRNANRGTGLDSVSVTHCDEDGDVEVGGFFHSFLMHPSLGKIICRFRLKLKLVQLEMLVSQMQKNGEAAHFKN